MSDPRGGISSQAIELLNRNEFIAPFLRSGFVPYVPEFDLGVDFILYREEDDILLKVQLKGRWTVDRKYLGRNIWIAFPNGPSRAWHLVPHDRMVTHGQRSYTGSASWRVGQYHRDGLPAAWRNEYDEFETSRLLTAVSREKLQALEADGATSWELPGA